MGQRRLELMGRLEIMRLNKLQHSKIRMGIDVSRIGPQHCIQL
jgi:hypothetical protein